MVSVCGVVCAGTLCSRSEVGFAGANASGLLVVACIALNFPGSS